MPIYTYTTLDDLPAVNGTFATGINDNGQIVGYSFDESYRGFLSIAMVPTLPSTIPRRAPSVALL